MPKLNRDNTKSYCHIYFFLLSLFVIGQGYAQKTQRQVYKDSILSRYVDATAKGYNKAMSYYIGIGSGKLPPSVRIIRSLDEEIAIIEINTEAAYHSLNSQLRIAPAGNSWK